METFLVFWLILLTLGCAYCSGSEIALFSLSPYKVDAFEESSDKRKKKIAELLRFPRNLLVTIFILNTVSSILLQNVASHLFWNTSGWGLRVGVPFVLILLFGEIIPKYLAMRNNVTVATWTVPSVAFLQKLLAPISNLTIKITAPISRIMFFFLRKDPAISKKEVIHALNTAKKHSILSSEETEFIHGYLDLLEETVKEIMRPKEDILYYDYNEPLTKLTNLFTEEKCTRLPICDKHLDNVQGILSATDFFVNQHRLTNSGDILRILHKPYYVPEVTPAKILLKHFYRERQNFALVVDEYGLLTGLITLEDIAEVVIGSVTDSRDQKISYTSAGKNEIIANGKMELDELNDLFGTNLSSENVVTVGGWLAEQFDGIPKNGTKLEREGLLFHILTVSPRRIERIYIHKRTTTKKQEKS